MRKRQRDNVEKKVFCEGSEKQKKSRKRSSADDNVHDSRAQFPITQYLFETDRKIIVCLLRHPHETLLPDFSVISLPSPSNYSKPCFLRINANTMIYQVKLYIQHLLLDYDRNLYKDISIDMFVAVPCSSSFSLYLLSDGKTSLHNLSSWFVNASVKNKNDSKMLFLYRSAISKP